ncbi:MAG: AraC family transcriptional regulator [Verrucomicrobiia bacterium]
MKRNGIEQLETKGHGEFGVWAGCDERYAGNGGLEIARKIEQSISYMLQHLDQPLDVATLAATASFSPSHYSALFKRWTGCPPIDYFIHLRMQHACWLFDSTSLNVREVAAALGYDDPFYFSRTFKSVNRVAPSEYRMLPEKLKDDVKKAALPFAFAGSKPDGTGQRVFGRPIQINGCAELRPKVISYAAASGFGVAGKTTEINAVPTEHETQRACHFTRQNLCHNEERNE